MDDEARLQIELDRTKCFLRRWMAFMFVWCASGAVWGIVTGSTSLVALGSFLAGINAVVYYATQRRR